jgi:hypothetical protein
MQTPCERRKPRLFVLRLAIRVRDTDAGVNPSLVNIQSAAVFPKYFEHGIPPGKNSEGWQGLAAWQNRVEFVRDKFTGYGLRHSLMP